MLSMALARSWARKLDTYSWSFLSSLLRAEEERVAARRRAALRARQRERF